MSNADDFRFDKRIIERNLSTGKVTQEEYQKFLKSLKDSMEEATAVEAKLVQLEKKIPTQSLDEEDEMV